MAIIMAMCTLLKVGSKFNAACVKTAHTAMSYCCTENVKSSCVGYISIKVVNTTHNIVLF